MAISLDSNRKSSYTFTKDDIGNYVFNEVKCTSSSDVSYKFRISTWLDSIDEINRKVKVRFNSRLYSDAYSAFSSFNVVTKVFVDDVQKSSKTITSLDKNSNVAGATWSGELQYDENGIIETTVKATLSCSSSYIYAPKNATVEIKLKFPNIEKLKNPSLKVYANGKHVDAIAYVFHNKKWIESVAYGRRGKSWVKGE
ncbi:MAG: hypothetical protein PUF50_03555 [Erysipelotrichaceae bacterium]|nr:hypothetical protein [Erysipelotrichaceae bacterium]